MSKATLLVAAKALIFHQGKLLLIREAPTNPDGTNEGKYDVVGGRIEPGEPVLEALRREIHEETGLDVEISPTPLAYGEWFPVVSNEPWQIVALYFVCQAADTDITLSREHDEAVWIDPQQHAELPLIENVHPVIDQYLNQDAA